MKIGIIGSGGVGKTLAKGFLKYNYEVMIGTEHKEKLSDFIKENDKLLIGNFSETAKFGDLLVLAVKGVYAKDVLNKIGSKILTNKIIVDTTNPISDEEPVNGVLKFFTQMNKSLMEDLQENFSKTKFVKAFNSIGSSSMINPDFEDTPTMFICGNDDGAKKIIKNIIEMFGFIPEDMGRVEASRAIESLCILWCIPGFIKNDWKHAFKLIR